MATTSEQQLKLPLLPGDNDEKDVEIAVESPPEEDVVVRVAINPSLLDRFLRSDYYYFYDDIHVPYQSLLIGAENELLPSQKERLVLAEEGGESSESRMFGYLWMRLCARLAKAKAIYIQKTRFRVRGLALLWAISTVLLGLQIIDGDERLSLFWFVPLAFVLYYIATTGKRFEDVAEAEAQNIVDDIEPLFSDEGFHVDLITSCPTMYIRFKKVSPTTSKSFASSSMLKETMERFQMQALHDHKEALVVKRQEKLKRSRPPGTLFGIRIETLLWWQPCLTIFVAINGIIALVQGFSIGTHF